MWEWRGGFPGDCFVGETIRLVCLKRTALFEGSLWIMDYMVSLQRLLAHLYFAGPSFVAIKGSPVGSRRLMRRLQTVRKTRKHKVLTHWRKRRFYGWLLKTVLKITTFNSLASQGKKRKFAIYNIDIKS